MSASPYSLDGRTILVTGASSGIGRACATLASRMGARLVLTGRHAARLHETLTALDGDGHLAHVMDLNDAAALPAWVQTLDPIDGLVYAAGIAQVAPFRMMSERHIQSQMDINFKAPMLLTQALLKARKVNSKASLVYIAAVADHTAPVGSAIYSASKAALITAVRSLALEVAKQRIRANCVSPGYVKTPMFEHLTTTASVDDLVKLAPLGLIEPEEVAHSVAYLLSEASRWVTRSNLIVDSGITIPMR
jgi:NAD(P)-dependent dehydrogenase (short-subunit alcohol dehydrogenase family)